MGAFRDQRLRLLVEELGTPKLAQIFAYGKWLYRWGMLLYGASDLDQRCLRTRRSAVVAFLGGSHQIYLPLPPKSPKTPFWGTLQCKIERALRKSHVNAATKLELYSYRHRQVLEHVSKKFSLGASGGRRAP